MRCSARSGLRRCRGPVWQRGRCCWAGALPLPTRPVARPAGTGTGYCRSAWSSTVASTSSSSSTPRTSRELVQGEWCWGRAGAAGLGERVLGRRCCEALGALLPAPLLAGGVGFALLRAAAHAAPAAPAAAAAAPVNSADGPPPLPVPLPLPLPLCPRSFVCPTEIIAFSDRAKEFEALNCQVGAGAGGCSPMLHPAGARAAPLPQPAARQQRPCRALTGLAGIRSCRMLSLELSGSAP